MQFNKHQKKPSGTYHYDDISSSQATLLAGSRLRQPNIHQRSPPQTDKETGESGYGEMIYLDPSDVNYQRTTMMSPNTEGRHTRMRSPYVQSVVSIVRNDLNVDKSTPFISKVTIDHTATTEKDRLSRSPKTINIGQNEKETEYNIRTLNASRSPQTLVNVNSTSQLYQTYNEPGNIFLDQPMTTSIQGQIDPNLNYNSPQGMISTKQSPDQYTMHPRELRDPLVNKMSPNKNIDDESALDPKGRDTSLQLRDLKNQMYRNTRGDGDGMVERSRIIKNDMDKIDYYIRGKDIKDNLTENEIKRIMRQITKGYDPTKGKEGRLISKSQMIIPGESDDIFNDRYRVLQKMNKLSTILLSKSRNSYEYNTYLNRSGSSEDKKTFDRNTLSTAIAGSKNKRSHIHNRSPQNRFLYLSLAMISSKGPHCEDRIILRKMRFDKGGVVDLAQESRKKKDQFKIKQFRRKNISGTGSKMLLNPKYRDSAAKIIQAWWRDLKERYQKVLSKIILIQSVWRGRWLRKYIYDIIYLSFLHQRFIDILQGVLVRHVRPIVWEQLFAQSKWAKEFLGKLLQEKDPRYTALRIKPYFDKWKDNVNKLNQRNDKLKALLNIRDQNEKNKNTMRKYLVEWALRAGIERYKQKLKDEQLKRISQCLYDKYRNKLKNLKSFYLYKWGEQCKNMEIYDLKIMFIKFLCGSNDSRNLRNALAKALSRWRVIANDEKNKEELKKMKNIMDGLHKLNKQFKKYPREFIRKLYRKLFPDYRPKILEMVTRRLNKPRDTLGNCFTKWRRVNDLEKHKNALRHLKGIVLKNGAKHVDDRINKDTLRNALKKWKYIIDLLNDKIRKLKRITLRFIKDQDMLNKQALQKAFKHWKDIIPLLQREDAALMIENNYRNYRARKRANNLRKRNALLKALLLRLTDKHLDKRTTAFHKWLQTSQNDKCNDKVNTIQQFMNAKLRSRRKNKAQDKINTLIKRSIYKQLADAMVKASKVNGDRGKILYTTLEDIYIRKPFNKLCNALKWISKIKTLRKLYPKLQERLRLYWLPYYLNKWKTNTWDDKINKITKIQNWYRGKSAQNKLKRKKRIDDLLSKFINKLLKNRELKLLAPLNKWNKRAQLLKLNEGVKTIQNAWRTKKAKDKVNALKDLYDRLLKVKKFFKDNASRIVTKRINNASKVNKLKNTITKPYMHSFINALKDNDKNNKLKSLLIKLINGNDNKLKHLLLSTYFNKWKDQIHKLKENDKDKNAQDNWKRLSDKLDLHNGNLNNLKILKLIRQWMALKKLPKPITTHVQRDVMNDMNDLNRRNKIRNVLRKLLGDLNDKNNNTILRNALLTWKDKALKLKERDNALDKALGVIDTRRKIIAAETLGSACLIKKLFNTIPKIRAIDFFNKLKQNANAKKKLEQLGNTLNTAKHDITNQNKKNLRDNLYKLFTYKIIDKLFNKCNDDLLNKLKPKAAKKLLNRLKYNLQQNLVYNYNDERSLSNNAKTTPLKFHKKVNNPKTLQSPKTKANPIERILPYFVEYLNNKLKARNKDTLDTLIANDKDGFFCSLYKRHTKKAMIPPKKDLINALINRSEYMDTQGSYLIKLFKLLRKKYIRYLCDSLDDPSRMYKMFYLLRLTMLHKKIAWQRYIREMIRKWRFLSFIKKVAKKKLELMYKNLHCSYLQMANEVFGDEDEFNPSVIKEFERFGNNVGMFSNEEPDASGEMSKKYYEKVSKKYHFKPTVFEQDLKESLAKMEEEFEANLKQREMEQKGKIAEEIVVQKEMKKSIRGKGRLTKKDK